MRNLLPTLALASLVACTATPANEPRTLRAQQTLDRYLVGRVAGAPVSCLPTFRSQDMITVDSNTILFRDGSTFYRNDPVGGCNMVGRPGYALVTRIVGGGGQLCRGDIATVQDVHNGFTVGSCSFGDFVPYTRVAAR